MSAYKPVNLCGSVEQYNLQIAEVDANAFAGLAMETFQKVHLIQTNSRKMTKIRKIK